ncbi:MAG: S1 RNA-binding domain-containing protein [Candidatus Taylorbacteria bacterium]|nr:S1 RNA-binding domain-containing protein [Candidatus Taylorbacteria bacterium]
MKEKLTKVGAVEAIVKSGLMSKYFNDSKNPLSVGEVVEGKVILIEKNRVYVDLQPYGTGLIFGKEFIVARDVIKKINAGDIVSAKIVEISNKEGYIELSLKEARQALIWDEAEKAIKEKTVFEIPIQEANKGGLMLSWQGITGFLPASQLKSEHYPKVVDGDKDKIFDELKTCRTKDFCCDNHCFSKRRQTYFLRKKS